MDVIVPLRCDWFTLDRACGYCGSVANVVRVTTLDDGRVHILTECERCARKERTSQIKKGWRTIAGANTIVDPGLMDSLPEELKATLPLIPSPGQSDG